MDVKEGATLPRARSDTSDFEPELNLSVEESSSLYAGQPRRGKTRTYSEVR